MKISFHIFHFLMFHIMELRFFLLPECTLWHHKAILIQSSAYPYPLDPVQRPSYFHLHTLPQYYHFSFSYFLKNLLRVSEKTLPVASQNAEVASASTFLLFPLLVLDSLKHPSRQLVKQVEE